MIEAKDMLRHKCKVLCAAALVPRQVTSTACASALTLTLCALCSSCTRMSRRARAPAARAAAEPAAARQRAA